MIKLAVLPIFLSISATVIVVGERLNISSIEPMIVGGYPAKPNEFPWLVRIQSDIGRGRYELCGGALIRMDLVLTAAHCVYTHSASKITVIAGDHYLNREDPTEQRQQAKSRTYHEDYVHDVSSRDAYINDIAVIKLKKSFSNSSAVQPIKLPPSDFQVNSTSGSTGYVAGWGVESYDSDSVSSIVRVVHVPIVTDGTCSRLIRRPDDQFCAGAEGKDSCQGDSGGPFVCHHSNGTICGIVSYGIGCGQVNSPGVYTKVSSFISWIEKNSASYSQPLTLFVPLIFMMHFFLLKQ